VNRPRAQWPLALVLASCGHDCKPTPSTECVPPRLADAGLASGCTEDTEPNGDLAMASIPLAASDCGRTERSGSIAGDGDVDVYRTGSCGLGLADPGVTLDAGAATLRMCLFVACTDGATAISCCYEHDDGTCDDAPASDGGVQGAYRASTQSGFQGCCRAGNGELHAKVSCDSLFVPLDDIEGYVWVDTDALFTDECLPYDVTYRMD
jgi:hypothetical protein